MAAADNNADVILEAALAQTAAGAQGQQCGPTDLIVKGVGSMQPLPDKVTDALAGHIEALGRPQELEEFVCHVCKDHAFGSPVSTTCDAGHLFHEECIERWLQDKTSCPVCRQELPTEKFRAVQTFVRSTINRAEVQCPQRCGATFPFDKLQHHIVAVCPNTDFACANQGCGVYGSRLHITEHTPSCPHTPAPWCTRARPARSAGSTAGAAAPR
eukprot:TRINITY_DN4909_c0_g1_i7.p1 TRINITY_DN4909_c0_g1~~TRINITY_DN4909_c0_g1_i7.p1  ORF type:complete len:244 (+),score=57.10 TRINITY_DN4909_c0_g1_i7:91-732(+)